MKKDWRQTKWSDFSRSDKLWFLIVIFLLIFILVVAMIANLVPIPNWVFIVWLILVGIALPKFAGIAPWAFGRGDAEEEEDESEEDEDDEEIRE